MYFATFGIINSFGFFQNYYQRGGLESVPAATVSFVGTMQITLMNVLAAPVGALFDCYGLKVRMDRFFILLIGFTWWVPFWKEFVAMWACVLC